jgi:fluoroacetyl-CoA thioesterase
MKEGLEPGVSNEYTITTTPDMGITHLGPDAPSMFSTPAMIQLIEGTCLSLMSRYFEQGEQSVGFHVDVFHLAPTVVGKKVTATATLKNVDGRKYTFDVSCVNEDGVKIGEGVHERAVIDIARFSGS